MAASAILAIKILADAKGAQKGMAQAEQQTSKWASGMGKASKVAAVGLAGVGAVMVSGVKAAMEDAQAQAVLAKTLQNTTGATKQQIAATEDYISKTSLASGVTDDELRPALGNLVRATKDQEQAQGLLATAMDVSAATGKPLEAVTMAIAKAYNGNVAALGRLGVKVTDSTKDAAALASAQLKVEKSQEAYNEAVKAHGPASKEAIEAQKKLELAQIKLGEAQNKTKKSTVSFSEAMARMGKQFKGASAASANTAAGRMKRLQVAMDEAKESAGSALLPVVEKLAGAFLKVAEFASKNQKVFLIIVGALAALAAAVYAVNTALKVYKATLIVIRAVQMATFLTNPVFLVIAAIVALVAVVVLLWKKHEGFRNFVKAMWAAIRAAINAVVVFFKAAWNVAFRVVKGYFTVYKTVVLAIFNVLKAAIRVVANFFKTVWSAAIAVVKGYFNAWKAVVLGVVGAIKGAWNTLTAVLEAPFKAVQSVIDAVIGKVQELIDKITGIDFPSFSLPDLNPFNASAPAPALSPAARGATTRASSGGGHTFIINNALDPEGVARAVKRVLEGHGRRMGTAVAI